jgi:hypothetical protein
MAEEKKPFPWWLVAWVVVLAILGTALGFIETVGRRGTLVGRYERIHEAMAASKALAILGPPDITGSRHPDPAYSGPVQMYCWHEGPAAVWIAIVEDQTIGWREDDGRTPRFVDAKRLTMEKDVSVIWHVRRWAEQAYTAIHGPR